MRGSYAKAREQRIEVEADADERLKHLDGVETRVHRAKAELMAEVRHARRLEADAARATQCEVSVLEAVDYFHGVQGRRDPNIAARFAAPLFRAVHWQLDIERLGAAEQRERAAQEVARLLPGVPPAVLYYLMRLPRSRLRWRNRDAGYDTGLTLGKWDALRAAPGRMRNGRLPPLQLTPAFRDDGTPLSEAEFRAELAERKRKAEKARRHANGAEPIEDRRAREANNRTIWAAYAKVHGFKPETAKKMARQGRIAYPAGLLPIPSGVPAKEGSPFNEHATSDGGAGGALKARPADPDPVPGSPFARSLESTKALLPVVAAGITREAERFRRVETAFDQWQVRAADPRLPIASEGPAREADPDHHTGQRLRAGQ